MRILAVLVLAATLSGCGAVYFSPKIAEGDVNGTEVRVRPITLETVREANRNGYRPKSLPSVFFATGAVENTAAAQTRVVRNLPPKEEAKPYTLGVGDVVLVARREVNVSGSSDTGGLLSARSLQERYTVQDDGAIAIPDVGRVGINGQSLEEAEATLFKRFVEAQIDPTFSIEVAEFQSKRVAVSGAVKKAAVAPIGLTPLRLSEALAEAGGVSVPNKAIASVRITRGDAVYQVPLNDVYNGRASSITLQDGDSVFVDSQLELEVESLKSQLRSERRNNFEQRLKLDGIARDYVYVTGEASSAGRFTMPFGQRANLADVLFNDGALDNQRANPRQIYVLREGRGPEGTTLDAWQLDITNAANLLLMTKFNMRPNDIVFVAAQPVTRWSRVINQISPSIILAGADRIGN